MNTTFFAVLGVLLVLSLLVTNWKWTHRDNKEAVVIARFCKITIRTAMVTYIFFNMLVM